jgi:gliding motility-associated-like protein
MRKLKFTLLILFFTQFVFSQLSNFNLSVTTQNGTCTSNGTITITVSNTTPGATILYSIYKLPNVTDPISVQSTGSLSGLGSGTYRVVATQSLGNDSGTQQQEVTITNQLVPLTYTVSGQDEVCGFDGTMTVNVSTGTAFQYEIFSGPVIKPLQTSNVFTGLTAGVYQVRAFDACNQGVTRTFTLFDKNSDLNVLLNAVSMSSCNSVAVGFNFSKVEEDGVIKYPLQVVTTVFPPSGSQIVTNSTIDSGNNFSMPIPYYENQPYNYSFSITDGCGTTYVLNGTVQGVVPGASYLLSNQECLYKKLRFLGVTSLILNSAPSTFSTSLPINYTSQIENGEVTILNLVEGTYVFTAINLCGVQENFTINVVIDDPVDPYSLLFDRNCQRSSAFVFGIQEIIMLTSPPAYGVTMPHDYTSLVNSANYAAFLNLPLGVYTFSVVDMCGQVEPITIEVTPISFPPTLSVLEGCVENKGTLLVSGQIETINLIAAPSAFQAVLPYNYTASLISNGTALALDMLPPGTYTFEIVDTCQITHTVSATVLGYTDDTTIDLQANCGSFNIGLQHSSTNLNSVVKFWLQKFNPVTNSWEHPFTGVAYAEGSLPSASNSVLLENNEVNYNLATLGDFRIVKSYKVYVFGSAQSIDCIRVLDTFEFKGVPKINDVYSVSCGNSFEVVVEAEGLNPLIYRIISKNNQPFLVENGNSGFFTGLEPAIYVFEVEDGCHNTVNTEFEMLNPNPLEITTNSIICNGEEIVLVVPTFEFIEYQWWKDNATSTILSTTNSLVITGFNPAIHNGVYHVRILYPNNPNSCLNQVLSYTIDADTTLPNAGQGGNYSYCGTQNTIDLNSLLQGNFDTNGTWTETSNSGTLSANLWNSTNVDLGTYSFTYRVEGNCSLSDEVIVNITLKEIPDEPIVSSDAIICEASELNLFATTIPNVTYNWVGPNGFSSSEQNPVIENISSANNGVYTVNVMLNECPSETASIEIFVNELPEFELFQNCINSEYVLSYEIQNNDAAVESDYDFSWFGPNNFSSNESQVIITRSETGIYGVTITDMNGCSATKEINVVRTICDIPNVITPNNDGSNDSFDLTGFGVKKIEIYNRWGRLVYDKENYSNEWYGQNNKGESLPDSTYYYLLQMEDESATKVGWIFVTKG